MLTSLKLWNEPNNLSHWDFLMDRGWSIFADLVNSSSAAVREVRPGLPLVLGGLSPIDPGFLRVMDEQGALDAVDIIALHGFPLDWTLWPIEEWPARLSGIRDEFRRPVWITETGVSSFASEEVAAHGLRRTRELLSGERVYWYTLLDLSPEHEATTRHKSAEGSSYFRHFHHGLLRHDGTPKRSLEAFDPGFGLCQWFHFRDRRTLEVAAHWFERLGVRHVRTGISWAESHLPGAWEWFDEVMETLHPFELCVTLCFTPPSRGLRADHTSPPRDVGEFAWFAAEVAKRYGTHHAALSGEQK